MSEVIWGLATTHVPSIGAAMDRGMTADPVWKPLFDGYRPAREWLAEHTPDVAILIYNDHANGIDLGVVPTFAIGTAARYRVADEGFGRRPVPDVQGSPELSLHLLQHLMDEGFDLTVFQELDVDHGFTVPLSIWTPDPGAGVAVPGGADPGQRHPVPAADRGALLRARAGHRPGDRVLRRRRDGRESWAPAACPTSWRGPAPGSSTRSSTTCSSRRSSTTRPSWPRSVARTTSARPVPRASS